MKETLPVNGIASSFVYHKMKPITDKGAGEGKLFIGSAAKSTEFDSFFEFETDFKYKLDKQNLLDYMHEVKIEYVYQFFNKYQEANIQNWDLYLKTITDLDDSDLYLNLVKQTDSSRYYVDQEKVDASDKLTFKNLIRKIIVPKLTNIVFEKDTEDKIITLRLFVNYDFSKQNENKELASEASNFSSASPHTHPKQIIYYGVPGCGKSHKISEMLKDTDQFKIDSEENQIVRTVFHPDYTNSDFIGQILPQVNDTKIEYNFVPGPFTKILAKALIHSENQYVLIIEEINRGNAAAIFGEIFQLLDRIKTGKTTTEKLNDGTLNIYGEGWSEYFFMNDEVNAYVLKEANLQEGETSAKINGISFSANTGIRLPPNLSILATMNTSDQNVFTLDNAFQRRWNMEYISNTVDTTNAETFKGSVRNQYESTIGETGVKWGVFRDVINGVIADPENSFSNAEDKQLGLFFVHADCDIETSSGKIDEKNFSNKVLKYLWNDIFKREKSVVFADGIKTFGDLLIKFTGEDAFKKCFQSKITDKLFKSE